MKPPVMKEAAASISSDGIPFLLKVNLAQLIYEKGCFNYLRSCSGSCCTHFLFNLYVRFLGMFAFSVCKAIRKKVLRAETASPLHWLYFYLILYVYQVKAFLHVVYILLGLYRPRDGLNNST